MIALNMKILYIVMTVTLNLSIFIKIINDFLCSSGGMCDCGDPDSLYNF